MGFTAVHADWGRLDASLDDLGCGCAWEDVHRIEGLHLACPECEGQVFARVCSRHARHFYHQQRPGECEPANESAEHHLLELELATAARTAGWRTELEVAGETRNWRADVLVLDEQGHAFMALEAQLSPMTPNEVRMRTDRYGHDGVAVCWIGLHGRPCQRAVSSLRWTTRTAAGQLVRHGLARYTWACARWPRRPAGATSPARSWMRSDGHSKGVCTSIPGRAERCAGRPLRTWNWRPPALGWRRH
ncbi:hypothetical protein GCM10010300_80890 [Streptomyces olivaceoviridis]|uniref:competence protein CoiA family protein n=1 Tax=Streptomyces olivaceoviridis TaxID=1921 RepID=UPI0019AE3787|nr:competence protein CoiA family protein [Streptomyces olivaceoviridis]GGZ25263.1 hypothetical protein GCM10010300_80890 [Streptomyces olivaceoviridis]